MSLATAILLSLAVPRHLGSGGILTGQSDNKTTAQRNMTSKIPYSTIQFISPEDSPAMIAEKAAKVLPRPRQSEWMRLERTFFVHFGPNTFRGVEWGNGQEDPAIFNPTAFDADQWMRTIKNAGGKMVILVCKHHDGLCLWQTRYTNHSVAASPWLQGKGSVVKDVAEAARKYGVKLGVYLSPADLYQLRTNSKNPDGYYGNGSPKLHSVIPTDPKTFKEAPGEARTVPKGKRSYEYEVDDYNRYFLNQLYELLTEYGEIDEVWFDGANPDPSVHETYDYAAWYDLIRKLQPNSVIAVKGPDVRWVGNEWGVGRETEWSVVPLTAKPDSFNWPDMQNGNLGGRDQLKPGSYLWWYPAEVNVPILYGWFWADKKPVRSAETLVNIYYESIGRNGNWLLNLSPDTRGVIPENQVENLRLMEEVLDETFAKNLAAGAEASTNTANSQHSAPLALDKSPDTWWEAASGEHRGELTLRLPKPEKFDVVSLQEAVDHRSQRIESFAIDGWISGNWKQVASQTTVGRKRILRLQEPIETDRIRIRILASRLEPTIANVSLYKQASLVPPPVITNRSASGTVSLSSPVGLPVVYTLDGTIPTAKSTPYGAPISLPLGGDVNAACVRPDGRVGMTEVRHFSGFAPIGWRAISADNAALDGNPDTIWTSRDGDSPTLTVDMGRVQSVSGLSYLPRQDKQREGIASEYRLETSVDGETWTAVIPKSQFGNIRNNPVLQEVPFAPTDARYFRFTVLADVSGAKAASIAEISLLPG